MAEVAVTTVIDKLVCLLDEEARLLGGVQDGVEDIKAELLYIQAKEVYDSEMEIG